MNRHRWSMSLVQFWREITGGQHLTTHVRCIITRLIQTCFSGRIKWNSRFHSSADTWNRISSPLNRDAYLYAWEASRSQSVSHPGNEKMRKAYWSAVEERSFPRPLDVVWWRSSRFQIACQVHSECSRVLRTMGVNRWSTIWQEH